MKILAPFDFEVNGVEKRKRNATETEYRGTVEVEIAEIDGSSAPVAFRWEDQMSNYDVDGVVYVRNFDGKLYVPVSHQHARTPGWHMTAEEFAESAQKGNVGRVRASESFSQEAYREIIATDFEERKRETVALYERRLLIDGNIWQEVGEPVYKYRAPGGFHSEYMSLTIGFVDPEEKISEPERTFSLLEFDLMCETYETVELNSGNACRYDEGMKVEVLIPECVTFDCSAEALLKTAGIEAKSASSGVDQWSDEKVVAWLGLRRDYQRAFWYSERVASYQREFEGAMNTLCETLGEWVAPGKDYTNGFSAGVAQKCIERWRDRGLEIEPDAAFRM